jgi:Rieske Fe-S protein
MTDTITGSRPRCPGCPPIDRRSFLAQNTLVGTPVAVVHASESSYLAFSLVCPHQGYLVTPNGSAFLCTGHGARFAADGHWIGGQPTGNLRSLPVAAGDTPGTLIVG